MRQPARHQLAQAWIHLLTGEDGEEGLFHSWCHAKGIPTDVEVGTLLQQRPDLLCLLSQPVLDIDLACLQHTAG